MNKYMLQIKDELAKIGEHYDVTTARLIGYAERYGSKGGEPSPHYVAEYDKAVNEYLEQHEQAKGNLTAIRNEYAKKVLEWAKLDAKHLNSEDVALLNSGISLEREDYKRLADKYATNYTMLRAVKDSAAKNDIKQVDNYSLNPAEKINAFDDVYRQAMTVANELKPLPVKNDAKVSERYGTDRSRNYRLWIRHNSFESSFEPQVETTLID